MEEVKNEGPKEMTLDEWKAMQDKERTKVEFNIRKPNEGTDSQWKKGYVLHKSKSEDVSGRAVFAGCCLIPLGLKLVESVTFGCDADELGRGGGDAVGAGSGWLLSCPVWLGYIPDKSTSDVGTLASPHSSSYKCSAVFCFRGLSVL